MQQKTSKPAAFDNDLLWNALRTRRASGTVPFWYAVKTTGIFCRPGCPSRLPRRQNVEFFQSPEEAGKHGYRACRRCHPDQARDDCDAIRNICAYIEQHLDEPLTLAQLAEIARLSPFHLQRKFKQATGVSPKQYARQQRLDAFKQESRRSRNVTEAMYASGFAASSRLYENAGASFGMTPAQYRNKGEGTEIRYTSTKSHLGMVWMAATAKGICAIRFGAAFTDLRGEFPQAKWIRDDEALKPWINIFLQEVESDSANRKQDSTFSQLPLDLQASAFQKKVWNYLRTIPRGETRSYSQVAGAIGRPTATRAVARACAENPVAIVIPCHRVTPKNGQSGGYRWGAQRKKRLLKLESADSMHRNPN
jgi:AraC family transcriptional regulator, regulatory protein of adaptative response / methylated-DNA-[protein]-cysteine methyltransferase